MVAHMQNISLVAADTVASFDATASWFTNVVKTIWTASTTPVQPPTAFGMMLCVLIAIAAVATPIWRIARNVITIAHEGGHAVVATLTGRRLRGIQLHSDTSGVTVSYGRASGIGLVLTIFVGYVAPSLWGVGSAALVSFGYATAALWLLVVLLMLMLLRIRNGYGLFAVVASLVLVIGVSWWGDDSLRLQLAYTLTWFLLIGAVRAIIELQLQRAAGRASDSDADQLAAGTRIPGIIWILIWLGIALASLWYSTQWMTAAIGGISGMLQGLG